MDKLNYIRELLVKFYEGSSTALEEQELIDFFQRGNVPQDLSEDKQMFQAFAQMQAPIDIPADLDDKILSKLNVAEKKDVKSRRVSLYSLSGMAAAILVILSVYLGFLKNNQSGELTQYAIEDPQIAYQEAMRTLEYVSQKWNAGTGELKNIDYVNKGMQNLQPLRKVSSGSKELQLIGTVQKANRIQRQ